MKIKDIIYDPPFEKKYIKFLKKLTAKEKDKFKERLRIFKNNIFDKRLETHKLKGNLKEYFAFNISYKNRIAFKIIDKKTVFFIEIGNHDTVY